MGGHHPQHVPQPASRGLYRIYEVGDEANFARYWSAHPSLKSGGWLTAMEATCREVAQRERLPCPILSPALATDVANGRFTSPGPNDVTEGLSIFRIRTAMSAQWNQLMTRSRVYEAMAVGTGTG